MAPSDLTDALLEDAARLAAHPRFDDAVEAYCVGLARLREAPRLVNMVVSTDVRWRIIGFLLYLHADRERFGPEGGATYGRLLALCSERNEASPRAIKSLLALLQFSGLVRAVKGRTDRRLKFYVPTERMDGFVRQWLRYGTAALDILEPEMQRGLLVDDRAFVDAFSVSGGRAQLEDPIPLADRVPAPLSSLKSMLGSYSVIVAVLLAGFQNNPTPSRHGMAKRYGLSRSQVNNVIQSGQNKGLFTIDDKADVVATPALIESFRDWISIELAFYARHMQRPGLPQVATPSS